MISQLQKDKANSFLNLHNGNKILVLFNTWDPGSSRLVEASGFKAVATTSMGIAASLGYPDCQEIPFTEMLEAVKRIVNKVNVPVTADVEGGYGNNPDEILSCIQQIINIGVVGINIEDSYKLSPTLVSEPEFCERIRSIRDLANSQDLHLVINARTDVYLASVGDPSERLNQSIRRGNKYREAGADCIFVPGVWDKEIISTLVKEIDSPINILANPTNNTKLPPSISELEQLGVARVSLGSSPMKATLSITKKIAKGILEEDSYNELINALSPLTEAIKAYAMASGQTYK